MRIFSTEQLGPKQSLTPEGYLLCEAVPIARTGSQLYAGHELPHLEAGLDGLITVVREESEVFSAATMASFEGKPFTVGHAFVDPESWGALAKGHTQNVRRGDGADSDLLVADLLITDAGTIGLVREETDEKGRPVPGQIVLREISCGYDADYEQDTPGVAFQRNIIGNHVALVERGRAGPRCSIQDEELSPMTPQKTGATSLLRRLLNTMKTGDAALIKRTADAAAEEVAEEEKRAADEEAAEEKKKTEDTLANLQKTVDALVAAIKSKDDMGGGAGESSSAEKVETGSNPTGDAEGEPDEEEKTKTADAMRDVVTRAEILAPGFTADAAPRRLAGVDAIVRKVLKTADSALVAPMLSGRTVDSLTAAEAKVVFVAASEVARLQNNTRGRVGDQRATNPGQAITPADINRRNAEFWGKRN